MLNIRKAAVIGAGNMGAQIAAHLANVGIPSLLMDIVPTELLPEEQKRGLTLQSPEVRNRVTKTLFERAKKLVAAIKEAKLKVSTQIQDQQLRVSSKSKDDLQKAIALVKGMDLEYPVQFVNYR